MKKIIIICVLCLPCCVRQNVDTPNEYLYITTHKIDKEITQENSCINIDNSKSKYKTGYKHLSQSPFVDGSSFSRNDVTKTDKGNYGHYYDNNSCTNPINISRNIEVSSISYPGTCVRTEYAGQYSFGSYTNTQYTYNSLNNSIDSSSTTFNDSMPMFNYIPYDCIKTRNLVTIDFYKDFTYLGHIEDKHWSEKNTDKTIEYLTHEFIKKLEKSARSK